MVVQASLLRRLFLCGRNDAHLTTPAIPSLPAFCTLLAFSTPSCGRSPRTKGVTPLHG